MVVSDHPRGVSTGEEKKRESNASCIGYRQRKESPLRICHSFLESLSGRILCPITLIILTTSRDSQFLLSPTDLYDNMAYSSENFTTNSNLTTIRLDHDESNHVTPLSSLALVLRGLVMTSIIVGAIFGNLLVITSVLKFERLRVITNYFVVSLAFADLLVAILVMPFNASMEITGKWVFGRAMCDIFNANDFLFSTASILHLCCISVDRYIAIIHPLTYETKNSRKRTFFMLLCTWIASLLISYIPVYSRLYTTEENMKIMLDDPDSCPFIVNKIYAGVSSTVSFWIPCSIMVFLYARVFVEARKQEKMIQTSAVYSQYCNARLENGTSPERDAQKSVRRRMKREHKAAKTLGIIVGAFILCFLPFFSWYVSTTMCGDSCPYPAILQSTLFWVGYFNSCLNPLIYAYFNREFRTAFKKLLHLDRCVCRPYSDSTASNALYSENNHNSRHKESNNIVVRL